MMKEKLNLSLERDFSSSSLLQNCSCDSSSRTYGSMNSLSLTDITDLSISIEEQQDDCSPEKNIFEEYYKEFRDGVINKELALLSQNHQDGVFVIPSLMSLQVWFGVLFVRDGPYKDGIFHFTIYFKDNYPETIPVIRFRSRVFHPQIEQRKGTLNVCLNNTNLVRLDHPTKSDERNKHHRHKQIIHVWQILKYVRSCFYHLDTNNAKNQTAATMFESNYEIFLSKCRNSVQNSLYAYEEQNYEGDNIIENPLKACLAQQHIVNGFKHFLSIHHMNNQNQNGSGADNVIGWAKHNLGKLLNNLNTYSYKDESFQE